METNHYPDYPDPDDLDSGRIHDAAVDLLRELDAGADPADPASVFGALCRAAYAGYGYGYLRARRDLRAGAVAVKLGKDAESLIRLEGEEAANVLKSFGLLPE